MSEIIPETEKEQVNSDGSNVIESTTDFVTLGE